MNLPFQLLQVLVAEGKIDEGPKDDEEINDDGEN